LPECPVNDACTDDDDDDDDDDTARNRANVTTKNAFPVVPRRTLPRPQPFRFGSVQVRFVPRD
jgi:hypothetical protein